MDATSAGQVTGTLFWAVLGLAGALKCLSISRRPATNTKCALALMFLLLGLALCGIVGGLAHFSVASLWLRLAAGGVALGFIAFVVVAVVFSILGLVELRQSPGRYTQGRAQAIWTLGLAGVMVLLMGAGFIRTMQRTATWRAGTAKPGERLTFDEYNFRIQAPPAPWVSMDAARLNRDAKVTFMRRWPEVYFFVIAERFGADSELELAQLVEIGKANLKSAARAAQVNWEKPWTVNGLSGVLVQSDASVVGQELHYVHWYFLTNGYAYQIVTYGRKLDSPRVEEEALRLLRAFELVDRERIADFAGSSFKQDFVSPRHHYRVEVANSAWREFPALEQQFPEAEFGMTRGGCSLAVVPVWLDGESPGREALTAGLLATMEVRYPDDRLTGSRPVTEDGLEGVEFDFARTLDKTEFVYRFKVLQRDGWGYLVAAWAAANRTNAQAFFPEAMSRVKFPAPPPQLLSAQGPEFTPRELKTRGHVLNQAGLYHFRGRDFEKALGLFQSASKAHGQEKLYVLNALQAWSALGQPAKALEFLKPKLAAQPDQQEFRAWQAYLQSESGDVDLALTNYAMLFAGGYRNDEDFATFARLLLREGRPDDALREIEAYAKQQDSATIRRVQAEAYRQRKDYAKAIAMLEAQREKSPRNPQLAFALAEARLDAGQFSESLALCRELLDQDQGSAAVWRLRGLSEYGLKWYREAKVSFEAALKEAPADRDLRNYLDHVSGMLGEGNNSLLKEVILPVPLPARLSNAPAIPAAGDFAKEAGAYYARRIQAVSFIPGKEYRTTEYQVIRVLDASGVSAFSTVQMSFDPLSEAIHVNEVRVVDAGGQTVSTGKVADCYVLDAPGDGVASQKKTLSIPVPGLHPGHDIHVTVTHRDVSPPEEFPFLEFCFSRLHPTRESVLFVRGSTNAFRSVASTRIEPTSVPEGCYWLRRDPPAARYEPLQPPYAEFLPVLWLNAAKADWTSVASNYLATIKDRLEVSESVRTAARPLVAGLTNAETKASVLARHVQSNYIYKAIEFGRRARVPNQAADILRNKYGDCKDHALLLQQMLTAAGLPARLALVNTRCPVQTGLPSLDQFDHMVVFLPEGTGGRFLDATDKGADLMHALPPGLPGKVALVLDESSPRLVPLARSAETFSRIHARRHLSFSGESDVKVDETFTLSGPYGAFWRNVLLQCSPETRRNVMQRQLDLPDAELQEVSFAALDDPAKPLQVVFSYRLKRQFRQVGNRLMGTLRTTMDRSLLSLDAVDKRLTPFETRFPLHYQAEVTLAAPSGFRPSVPDDPAPALDARFGDCESRAALDAGMLRLEVNFRQATGSFTPGDYSAFRETRRQVLSQVERQVVLEPVGR
ncbi:MAG TPA: tetratricopeptide repeat protein [Verrucomicrobiae bacterium]